MKVNPMRIRRAGGPLLAAALLSLSSSGAVAQATGARPAAARAEVRAADPGLARLEREIARLEPVSGGTMGVVAVHLETGRRVALHADMPFPMASTYKVAIATAVLTRVDRGELRLDSMVTIQPEDLHPGSGTLTDLFNKPGVALSVRNILELMMLISDNSAADLSDRLSGGPAAVTARVRALGVDGLRVDRYTSQLIGDWLGVADVPADGAISPERFRELARAVPADRRQAAEAAFSSDPRDQLTPDAMLALLTRIWRGKALSPASTSLLLDIMSRCQTGPDRIKGMLPPGTVVAHKTGTIGGTANDVGIITLPDGAGHVAVALFIKDSKLREEERVKGIAQIARAVYDYFTFNPGESGTGAGTPR